MKEASFYQTSEENKVQCLLCPHLCVLSHLQKGICGARINLNGKLFSRNYEIVSAVSLDPIEKKPLYHYYPGEKILSVGTFGCNLHCPFCQNDSLSRFYDRHDEGLHPDPISSDQMLSEVKKSASFGLAYTYSEPVVWYEFVRECAEKLHAENLKNILVTNAFIQPDPLKQILPFIDAVNVDLKAFTQSDYQKLGGNLKPVLNSIELIKNAGIHIEISTLIVPGINSEPSQLRKLFQWIAALDPSIPIHVSRYFPHHRYSAPPTPLWQMEESAEIARSLLKYVYIGNVSNPADTFCPHCGAILVHRERYQIKLIHLKKTEKGQVCEICGKNADFILN